MKKVVVVIDDDGNEAIYCNGFYVENEGDTVYACDIHGVADGQPIVFEHRRVHHQWDAPWPIQLKDLELRSRDSDKDSTIDFKLYQPDSVSDMTTFDNLEHFFLEDNEHDTKEEVEAELRSYGVDVASLYARVDKMVKEKVAEWDAKHQASSTEELSCD